MVCPSGVHIVQSTLCHKSIVSFVTCLLSRTLHSCARRRKALRWTGRRAERRNGVRMFCMLVNVCQNPLYITWWSKCARSLNVPHVFRRTYNFAFIQVCQRSLRVDEQEHWEERRTKTQLSGWQLGKLEQVVVERCSYHQCN